MNAMFQIVAVATADLTEAELVGINQIAHNQADPRHTTLYARVRDLFTENDGTRLYPATQQALAAVTLHRLTQP